MINVALGGTLIQDVPSETATPITHNNKASDTPLVHHAHPVTLNPQSLLANILGAPEVEVNSLHHQAVGTPGDGVVVTGTAEDGVVEAFEVAGRPEVFAVQWHPEMLSDAIDPAFVWLVREASSRS